MWKPARLSVGGLLPDVEPDLVDLEAVVIRVERVEEPAVAGVRRRALGNPRTAVVRRVVEVVGVAAGHAHVHVDRLPELAHPRERALLLLLLAHHLLRVLEQPALVLDLLLLSIDLLLEPFDELAHLGELFVDTGARKRRPSHERTRRHEADQLLPPSSSCPP